MKKLTFNWTRQQIIMYLVGCFGFSLGAKFFIDSNLGVDPLDVLNIGLAQLLHITIGIASGIVAILFLTIWSLWNRRWPPLTPFVTMFLVGNLIDLWNLLNIGRIFKPLLPPVPMLITGLIVCAYASAFIIMSGIGIRIMDLIVITMVMKWRWRFYIGKLMLEVALCLSGWLLGGPVGVATIAFICLVGPLIQPFMLLNQWLLALPNHGMGEAEARLDAAPEPF
jgi:uncharacterized membrane protein YczE